ncbi:MAG: sigma-54 dependent transcriptional regulator [Bacteroidetes bacterium]|nr:sigma-54 dependent transcriptional regulator [Bacteroidota bacterium]
MENKHGNILIIDDNEEMLLALKVFLAPHFSKIVTEKNPNLIPVLVKDNFDIILLDMNFSAGINSGNEGFFWMNEILKIDSNACIVFITAYSDVELAVKAIKEGAADFIQKSWDEKKILSTVMAAYKLRRSKQEISQLKSKQKHLTEGIQEKFHFIHGSSPSTLKVIETIKKISATEASILLLGENGTGKEVIAREIHQLSKRKDGIFVSIDLGAISESLFESELFGHIKGAFTDANEDRTGRFEIASGGTLFLDEIGNLPLHLQSKLLSVIQNREITRVGSSVTIPIDIRLICATNKDLYKMLDENSFREDLLYRINTIQIEIPPLRERSADIENLTLHFLNLYAQKYKNKPISISKAAIEKLKKHSWFGNIRELQHTIEKAVIMTEAEQIMANDLSFSGKTTSKNMDVESLNLAENEKQIILKAIQKFKGNMSLTAKELGINRSTLYDKMKKYDL